jgi:hypothetical protein
VSRSSPSKASAVWSHSRSSPRGFGRRDSPGSPPVDALTALLLLHAFRTAGLAIIVPEVGVDPNLPRSFATPAAYGDLIAAVLALLAITALRNRIPLASFVVWIFSVEGWLTFSTRSSRAFASISRVISWARPGSSSPCSSPRCG